MKDLYITLTSPHTGKRTIKIKNLIKPYRISFATGKFIIGPDDSNNHFFCLENEKEIDDLIITAKFNESFENKLID